MRKIFLYSLTTLLYSFNSLGVTLEEALTSGYSNNEKLLINRTDFLAEVEVYPQALANFMPKIYATFNGSDIKSHTQGVSAIRNSNSIILEQPLFNGFSSAYELKAAQASFVSSMSSYYSKEQDTFLEEIKVYLDCISAKEKYNISKVSVKSNKTVLEAIREKFKLGESTETEVAAAREGLATAESNEAVAYANYETTKAGFFRTFGIEPIDLKMPSPPLDPSTNLEKFIEEATTTNPSVVSATYAMKASKAHENSSKGKLLPTVSFKVESGVTKYSPQIARIGQTNDRSTTSTLSVVVPILARGGAEYSDVRRTKYQTRKSAVLLDYYIKQIAANARSTWAGLDAAKLRIKATDQAVKASEVAYDGITQEEMLGSKTVLDVLTAEDRLNNAKITRVDAQSALIQSAYQMKSMVGELTAKSMGLKVEYFDPELEFKKIKLKIIGF